MTKSELEQEIRRRMQRPAPPQEYTHEITSVDEEVEKYPQLRPIVEEDRRRGFTESTISHLLVDSKEILGLGLEERVRRNMGLPKPKRKGKY